MTYEQIAKVAMWLARVGNVLALGCLTAAFFTPSALVMPLLKNAAMFGVGALMNFCFCVWCRGLAGRQKVQDRRKAWLEATRR